ncbi:MAG: hypothetical protein N2038_10685 [Geminicoccaceae bacterium]|nr:hypothetical protein [Geminicoccaceae bacterium]MDW8444034.1 hypothetical protein [Acetobacteraceae bacterium]MCS7268183.1 hypothetical protein [Geminicoccaceae bacterium]MCX7630702.1 hypothetical protein [Geminicoccaceae bacterium]MDW8125947.1 hypothetical protein [Geminicoccaceae bacterium]
MNRRIRLCALLLAALPACARLETFSAAALEQRRAMNDLQARLTLAATCDISLGAYFRELSELERHYVGLVCGGVLPPAPPARPAP